MTSIYVCGCHLLQRSIIIQSKPYVAETPSTTSVVVKCGDSAGTNDGHHEPKPGDQDTSASDTENTEKENCFT